MENEEYTEIEGFDDQLQANLAKEILQSNNINCLITGKSEGLLDFNNITQIKLRVSKSDQKRALELLEVFFPDKQT